MPLRILGLAAAAGLAVSSAAVAQDCATSAEREAHIMRHLQTQLMVGALSCRGPRDLGQRDQYNRFVERHGPALRGHAEVFLGFFERRYGTHHQAQIDGYITDMANMLAVESARMPEFCDKIAEIAARAVAEDADLVRLADQAPIALETTPHLCRRTVGLD